MRPRLWLVLPAIVLLTLLSLPVQALAVALRRPARHRIPMLYHRALLVLIGVRVRRVGALSAARPLLLVCNHVSWLDIVVLGAQAPLAFVAKSEVGGWPGIGLLARLAGTVFVDRSRRTATGAANRAIAERLRAGMPVVLFAEGTSGDGTRVLPFRSALLGAAQQALVEGGEPAAVQPLALAYVRQQGLPLGRSGRARIAWYGDMDLVPHLLALIGRGAIDAELHAGPPLAALGRKEQARAAEQAVVRLLAEARRGAPGAFPFAGNPAKQTTGASRRQ
ncbi:MAG TPA: lysophospholipid acyltransferase family protein [Xanthobacteraceae bacterium]|nr:lysophospholipid acyltransferase family protein [Xanthobacteraceae bacterium]